MQYINTLLNKTRGWFLVGAGGAPRNGEPTLLPPHLFLNGILSLHSWQCHPKAGLLTGGSNPTKPQRVSQGDGWIRRWSHRQHPKIRLLSPPVGPGRRWYKILRRLTLVGKLPWLDPVMVSFNGWLANMGLGRWYFVKMSSYLQVCNPESSILRSYWEFLQGGYPKMDQNTLGHKKTCHGRKGLISFNPLLFPDALDAPAEGVWTGCWTAKLFASQCKLE